MGSKRSQVAKDFTIDYEDFMMHPEPFQLKQELAALRTMMIEFREAVENRKEVKVLKFAHQVEDNTLASMRKRILQHFFDKPDAEDNKQVDLFLAMERNRIVDTVYSAFATHLGKPSAGITSEDVLTMTRVLDAISKVAERAKKIEDGIVLRLDWGVDFADMLSRFIIHVVFPNIPFDNRPQLAKAAKAFLNGQGRKIDQEQRAIAGEVAG